MACKVWERPVSFGEGIFGNIWKLFISLKQLQQVACLLLPAALHVEKSVIVIYLTNPARKCHQAIK